MAWIIRFFNRLNFQKKLTITYVIVSLLSVTVVGGYFTVVTRDLMRDDALKQCRNDVRSVQNRVTQIISRINDVSDELYFNKTLERFYSTQYQRAQQAFDDYKDFAEFDRILRISPEIRKIKIYLDNQSIFENGQFMRLTPTIREEDWYRAVEAENGTILWQQKTEETDGKKLLHLTRLIRMMDKTTIGVLDIELDANYLYSAIKNENYYTMLLLDGEAPFATAGGLGEIGVQYQLFYSGEKGDESRDVELDGAHYFSISTGFSIPPASNQFSVCIAVPAELLDEAARTVWQQGFFVSLAGLMVSFLCLSIFAWMFSRRINVLRNEMNRVVQGDFEEGYEMEGQDEIAILNNDINSVRRSMKSLLAAIAEERKVEEELRKRQREIDFQLLNNQIDPHFLFNTLETLRMKAHCNDQKEIARAIKLLSGIMRSKMELKEQLIVLKEEFSLMRDYLEIQKFRYGERVNYTIDADSTVLEYEILPFLIQPIVENAFMHGLENQKGGGHIYVHAALEQEVLVIRVSDNGVGISLELLGHIEESFHDGREQLGIGLKNVHERIRLYYGDAYGVSVRSEFGRGTVVTLTLPGGGITNVQGGNC